MFSPVSTTAGLTKYMISSTEPTLAGTEVVSCRPPVASANTKRWRLAGEPIKSAIASSCSICHTTADACGKCTACLIQSTHAGSTDCDSDGSDSSSGALSNSVLSIGSVSPSSPPRPMVASKRNDAGAAAALVVVCLRTTNGGPVHVHSERAFCVLTLVLVPWWWYCILVYWYILVPYTV